MLVLTRRVDESIIIGDDIEVTIVDVRGHRVQVGTTAPKDVPVHRDEIWDAIKHMQERTTNQIPSVHFNGDEPLNWNL